MRQLFATTYATGRKVAVGVVGVTVLSLGIALIVLPGPAFIVIPAGLAILAIEFAWARRWLEQARDKSNQMVASLRGDQP